MIILSRNLRVVQHRENMYHDYRALLVGYKPNIVWMPINLVVYVVPFAALVHEGRIEERYT